MIAFGYGEQSHRVSPGKCAPGAIAAGVHNCFLKENVRASYLQRNVSYFCNNKTIKYDGTVLDCLRKREEGGGQAAGKRSLIQYQTDYFTNYSAFCIVPQRRGAGNLNCTAAREPLCLSVRLHQRRWRKRGFRELENIQSSGKPSRAFFFLIVGNGSDVLQKAGLLGWMGGRASAWLAPSASCLQ